MTSKTNQKVKKAPRKPKQQLDAVDLRKEFTKVLSAINSVQVTLNGLVDKVCDNGDTTAEQAEEYRTKVAHMLASNRFGHAEDFLRNVYVQVEERNHITKKQMAAVDRIALRQLPLVPLDDDPGDPFPWVD